jgi:plastocyanin
LSFALLLGACAQPPGVETSQSVKDAQARVTEEALAQAQLPESPQDSELVNLPSALMQGDVATGYSTQQVRALSRQYQYMRQGNQFFAYRRVGNRNEPVIILQRGRPYRVVYVFVAPYYYYRLVPFYGQYTFPGRGQAVVTIQNYSYRPSVVRVRQDGRVTWVNQDQVAHTATAPLPGQVTTEGAWDLVMQPGQSASRRFMIPGRYDYYCRFHPRMRGAVVVEASNVMP